MKLFAVGFGDDLVDSPSTGLAELGSPEPGPLKAASRSYQKAIDKLAETTGLAA